MFIARLEFVEQRVVHQAVQAELEYIDVMIDRSQAGDQSDQLNALFLL